MGTVLFTSARPLERAENIKAVWDAYDGEKEFFRIGKGCPSPDYRQPKYDLLVADELPTDSPGKCIWIGHGMGAGKTYGLQQPGTPYRGPDLITYAIASSVDMVPMVQKFTGLPKERVIPLGMPRTDAYFTAKKTPCGVRHFLYAPTFRWGWPWLPDWERLDGCLNDGTLFDVKAHMVTGRILPTAGEYMHIVEHSPAKISTPYLVQTDVLVTDYSSIMFDGMVLRKPLVLFAKDREYYLRQRGMYCEYPAGYSDRFCSDEKDLAECLENAEWDDYSEERRQFFTGACDGRSTARTIDLIKSLTEERSMKVYLPNGAIAESNNPIVCDQWKKAGYREVHPPAKPEGKPEAGKEADTQSRRRNRKK